MQKKIANFILLHFCFLFARQENVWIQLCRKNVMEKFLSIRKKCVLRIALRRLLFSKCMILFLEPLIILSDRSQLNAIRIFHRRYIAQHLRIEPLHAHAQCQHIHIEIPNQSQLKLDYYSNRLTIRCELDRFVRC